MTNFADWCVSSRTWTTETPTIDGTPQDVTAPAGGLYLIHPTSSLDLLARVVVAMAAAGVVAPAAFITEDRRVRLTSSGVFTITWNTATILQDLLGFAGDLAGADAYTADTISTLLWSPAKIFTPELAPLDAHGQPVKDMTVTQGPQGRQTVRQEGEATVVQRFSARHLAKDRFWLAPPAYAAGEFAGFWDLELSGNEQWYVLRRVVEGDSATVSANYSVSGSVGPYKADLTNGDFRRLPFRREIGNVELYYAVTIPAVQTAEFSA